MKNYVKPTKQHFNPDFYILHTSTNDSSPKKSYIKIADDIIKVAEIFKSNYSVALSAVVAHADKFKEKVMEVNEILVLNCCKKHIPRISHDNINPKRHLDRSKLHFNDYGKGLFARNLKGILNRYQ